MRRNNSKSDASGTTEKRTRLGEDEDVSELFLIKRPRNLISLMDPRTHTRTRHSSSTAPGGAPLLPAASASPASGHGEDDEGKETTSVETSSAAASTELSIRPRDEEEAGRITSSNEAFSQDDEDIEMADAVEDGSTTGQGVSKKLKSAAHNTGVITLSHHHKIKSAEDSNMRDYLNTSIAGGTTNMSSMNNSDAEDVASSNDDSKQHQQPNNKSNNNNNPNIFKPFDFRTGQFLRTTSNDQIDTPVSNLSPPSSGRAHSNNSRPNDPNIPPEVVNEDINMTESPVTNTNTNTSNNISNNNSINRPVNITTFMKFYTNHKTRSHSVPTILHSSLRRMTTTQIPTETQNNLPFNSNAPYHQPSTTFSGVTKKKNNGSSKPAVNFAQVAEETANSSSNSTSTDSGSSTSSSMKALRKAMILSQQFQGNDAVSLPTSTSTSSSLDERIEYLKRTPEQIPLPPINLQGLKEIDLHEIMKNPQLRHDIIFDPLLQFRPNLDGERGVKKRQLSSKYWNDVENEIIVYTEKPELFDYNKTRLVPLFDTLREVLLTIVPQKEAATINNVLDTELNMQELLKGSLVMTNLAQWLAELFKRHCAPMRDAWVDKMSDTFKEAEVENSLPKLIEGLRIVFQILETMKLDIANHQIRILRPALLSNAVEFEKQYFNTLMNSKRLDLQSSLKWFAQKFHSFVATAEFDDKNIQVPQVYRMCIKSIISLLSCRKMVRDYPMCLSFDHARLILLRADIRQIVCLQVCRLLFQQLVANDTGIDKVVKNYIINTYTNKRLRNDIVSIITDDHGNCRWTKNTMSISVHLCKVISDLTEEYEHTKSGKTGTAPKKSAASTKLDNAKINFAKSWLCKQTQPLSDVYGVLENRIFKILEDGIFARSACTLEGRVKQDFVYLYNASNSVPNESDSNNIENSASTSQSETKNPGLKNISVFAYPQTEEMKRNPAAFVVTEMDEFNNVFRHLYTVVNLHWSVFGQHYVDYMGDKVKRKGI